MFEILKANFDRLEGALTGLVRSGFAAEKKRLAFNPSINKE